jgi:ABC-2 type transport system permease protein
VLKIVLLLKYKSLKAQLQHPINFAMEVLGVSLTGFLSIPLLLILTQSFPSIGGWTFWQLGFMVALLQMAQGVHHALFLPFWGHVWLIQHGDYDRLLVRPLHPLLQILASGLSLSAIGEFLPGAVLFVLTCSRVEVLWSALNILFLVMVVVSAAVIEWAVYLFFATFDFWLIQASLLYVPTTFLSTVMRYPLHIYGRVLGYAMTFVLPFAFMAYYPTHYFFQLDIRGAPAFFAYLTPLVAVLSAVVAVGVWSVGLRHYQGTGT